MLSAPPPADVSTFLAFPSPEKLLRLGPKSPVLIAQQVGNSAANSRPLRASDWEGTLSVGVGAARCLCVF